jgi:protein-tyrosine phosphatase
MNRHLNIPGTYNVRDLGGYLTQAGQVTRYRVLLRAGNLNTLSSAAQQQLIQYGVATVVDLRDEQEIQQFPTVFAQTDQVQYFNRPLLGTLLNADETWQAEKNDYTLLHELYCKYLERCQSQIGAVITTIAEQLPNVVFHCHAGKDRTGIIAVLLLAAVGVTDDAIAEDYSLSASEIRHLVEQWRIYAVQHGQDMVQFERDVVSTPETAFAMLTYLNNQYGSVEHYLRVCGVTQFHLTQLRAHLLE